MWCSGIHDWHEEKSKINISKIVLQSKDITTRVRGSKGWYPFALALPSPSPPLHVWRGSPTTTTSLVLFFYDPLARCCVTLGSGEEGNISSLFLALFLFFAREREREREERQWYQSSLPTSSHLDGERGRKPRYHFHLPSQLYPSPSSPTPLPLPQVNNQMSENCTGCLLAHYLAPLNWFPSDGCIGEIQLWSLHGSSARRWTRGKKKM